MIKLDFLIFVSLKWENYTKNDFLSIKNSFDLITSLCFLFLIDMTLKNIIKISYFLKIRPWTTSVTKAARKSLIIGIALVVLEEFSGCYLLLYRVGSIFDNFEGISPDIASIIIGFIQVAGAYCSTLLIERLGRKILTITSSVGILLGMLLTGFTIPLNGSFFLKLLPVIGLSIALFFANIGAFVLTYVVLAEITPSKVNDFLIILI